MKSNYVLFLTLFVAGLSAAAASDTRVLVWDEQQPQQKLAYADKFLGETIADYLKKQPHPFPHQLYG